MIGGLLARLPWGQARFRDGVRPLYETLTFVGELVGGDATRERLLRLGRWTTINGRYILGALLNVLGLQNLLKAFGS